MAEEDKLRRDMFRKDEIYLGEKLLGTFVCDNCGLDRFNQEPITYYEHPEPVYTCPDCGSHSIHDAVEDTEYKLLFSRVHSRWFVIY